MYDGAVRIPSRLLRTLLLRGGFLGLLAHLAAVSALKGAASMNPAAAGPPSPILIASWAITVCALLLLIDLRRRKELMLLHNLGVTTTTAVSLGTLPAVAFELIFLRALA